ncbi:radical SAM domain protein [Methylophaga aminisulfidivorans MP]|uniref:Radical SAM domain protein n=1 Tax=Methylophaga aminisulfidivorans MP TaxID=1026882 RepID=F5SZG3_9GAMM|nr:radical SAM protein [Methylophaga aminisulfidivorans]EGL54721.1 radical SAM domain protein [Methylophaga aminisulfidivorans MP]
MAESNSKTPEEVENILEQARRGIGNHTDVLLAYIKSFDKIVLRGAGNFGSAFGLFLTKENIPAANISYWDKRYTELRQVNGLNVEKPFSYTPDKGNILIINCIPNGSLSGSVGREEFISRGYSHYLSGMALFEALMCGIKPQTGFDAKVCLDTTFCNWCSCKRLSAMMPKNMREQQSPFVYSLATFVINQKCTLSCSHCGQYINHYSKEERINFSLDKVKSDIDNIFESIDGIGYVSIIGGEPFVHPELDKIIEHVLTKTNFGVIGITTNGICDIEDSLLEKLNNGKTRIIFSDYTAALNENQIKLFKKNVNKVASSGISFTVGQPIWATPASLRKLNLSESEKIHKKANCNSRVTCKTIQNGVYYPCSTTAAMGSHQLANFQNDWVELGSASSAEELRKKILQVDEQPFYESCDHCGEGGDELAISGEQGVSERYIHIDAIKRKKSST